MYNFKEIEKQAKQIVKKKDIEKAISDDPKRKKLFSFLEGPPTANAPPALHHLEVRTYKDVINKFRYMQGYNVPRKAGWDCHGLPVEVQIEKKLKLNSKKEILTFGEANFINECRKSVFEYIDAWNKSTERLSYWADLDNPYATLQNDYIESVWWSLKELHKKNLLYEAHKVVPFCPRCQTPLSSHEVAQGYKKVTDESVLVKFELKKNEYALVFTTTPWTLPSNVGIAVNPNIVYAFVKEGNETFILAEKLVENCFDKPKIVKRVKGKELLGMKYTPMFPYFKKLDGFRIVAGDFVTDSEGTGLVHLAPAFGEEDYGVCKKEKLPFVQPIDENGKFTSEVPEYEGKFMKSADKEIIKRLEEEGKLFKRVSYEHDYPYCWRCATPLMYYAIKSWFIRVTAEKDKLLKNNEKINWTPKHIQEGRFGEWLRNVKDWALSRKKFWGTPLPVWKCSCGNEEVIGSVAELREKSTKKFSTKEMDLHKPWIDGIELKCGKCGKNMARVSDVIDCWYDSGSASFAQFHYPFENKEEFERRFPYDYISEAIDQTRGWFYTLHVLGTLLFGKQAYKNVICAGHIIDEKGEKMSKSKGNVLDPDMVLDTVGVDATRLKFCVVDIGDFKKFGIESVKKEIIPFLNVYWNTYQYYLQINNDKKAEERIEDKWILSRLNSTIKTVTEQLESYQIEKALVPLMDFIVNDFSKTYIKMVRDREDKNVKNVVGEVLEKTAKMLAPFAPNISDVIYQEFDTGTVHLSQWPELGKIDGKLEEDFNIASGAIMVGLAERDKAKIGLRWPLAGAEASFANTIKTNEKEIKEVIKQQLNVKEVKLIKHKEGEPIIVKLDTSMTPELEGEGYAREISRRIQAERKNRNMRKEDRISLELFVDSDLEKLIMPFKEMISDRTGSKKIAIGTKSSAKAVIFEVKDKKIGFVF